MRCAHVVWTSLVVAIGLGWLADESLAQRLRCRGRFAIQRAGCCVDECQTAEPTKAERPTKPAEPAKALPATAIPVPRDGAFWTKRQEELNERVKKGTAEMIFIGDSITHGWENAGKDVWQEFYGKRNAVNLGIGGDQTQHVLWRLLHGNIQGIHPKLAVLMIGTNNAAWKFKPEQIAAGVQAIVAELRSQLPETKVLVLAIFPRGPNKDDPLRRVNAKTNEQLRAIADGTMVRYLDIGAKFVEPDGTLAKTIMPDLLHLSPKGYRIWAEAIEPAVAKVMGAK